jgi:uncharacterized protein (DUF1015 family)
MTQIAAFRGLRYNPAVAGRMADLIAPPYDVIAPAQRQQLAARSEFNVVHVDLPEATAEQPDKYAAAAGRLKAWIERGVLRAEPRPGVYVYGQVFRHGGRTYDRRGMLVRVRLPEPGGTAVHEHERTLDGPKADRLALTKATRCNLSPVFALYPDPANAVLGAVEEVLPDRPVVDVADDAGVRHQLWVVTDFGAIERAGAGMAAHDLYIADGHHRYNTAVDYRNLLLEQGERLDADHPANFLLMQIVSMSDPGLAILPTHRVVGGLADATPQQVLDALSGEFEVRPVPDGKLAIAEGQIGLKIAGAAGGWLLTPKGNVLLEREPRHSAVWRELDVAILHRAILDELLVPLRSGEAWTIQYVHDAAAAEAALGAAGAQLAFLLAPTPLAALRKLSETAELMPPKSTYFHPKLATGLVINPLYEP